MTNPELTAAVERMVDNERIAVGILQTNLDRDADAKDTLNSLVVIAVNALHWERKRNTELRTLCDSLAGALSEVKNAVRSEPAMNHRGYDGIGIRVNAALTAYSKFKEGK